MSFFLGSYAKLIFKILLITKSRIYFLNSSNLLVLIYSYFSFELEIKLIHYGAKKKYCADFVLLKI